MYSKFRVTTMTTSQHKWKAKEVKKLYTPETENFLRRHFKSKDVDKNGYLDIDEFEECLKIMGIKDPPEEDLVYLKKHLDTDGSRILGSSYHCHNWDCDRVLRLSYMHIDKPGNGKLEVEELLQNIGFINHHLLKKEQLMAEFTKHDLNKDHHIQQSEMLKALMTQGVSEPESRKLIRHIYKEYDLNADSRLNYAEFVHFALEDDYDFLQKMPLKK